MDILAEVGRLITTAEEQVRFFEERRDEAREREDDREVRRLDHSIAQLQNRIDELHNAVLTKIEQHDKPRRSECNELSENWRENTRRGRRASALMIEAELLEHKARD
jgi:hypothetical protein